MPRNHLGLSFGTSGTLDFTFLVFSATVSQREQQMSKAMLQVGVSSDWGRLSLRPPGSVGCRAGGRRICCWLALTHVAVGSGYLSKGVHGSRRYEFGIIAYK
ncbi:hypothetical protein DUI87_15367 [Hirundo rustica rustica]|uniref:Uncharacterized protein n=1 Tax=Hirundo rustica rustica TaxID=333673 RepID=A0A3M0K3Y1_HIRRU|nr:hypothetical protein DUI87_15367 [Hirundo rustica rustica]